MTTFWKEFGEEKAAMEIDEFVQKLDDYLEEKYSIEFSFWKYCKLVNKNKDLKVSLEEANNVFNKIPIFIHPKEDELTPEFNGYPPFLASPRCIKMEIMKSDRKTLMDTEFIWRKDTPYMVGSNMLADYTINDPDVSINQFYIQSYDHPAIPNAPGRMGLVCTSSQNLTLFQIPPYPCKVRIFEDIYIFLIGNNNWRFRIQECRSGKSILGNLHNFIDPWGEVGECNEKVKIDPQNRPYLILTNEGKGQERKIYILEPTQQKCIFYIGREKGQDVQIVDRAIPKSISSRHCLIGYDLEFGWYIGENPKPSMNGTFIALNTSNRVYKGLPSYPFFISDKMNFIAGRHGFTVLYIYIYI